MDGKLHKQILPMASPVGAEERKAVADSPMRRKLVNALVGGALLHTLSPMEALAMGIIPGTHDAIDTMYLEFLRKLLAVATHDDLADMPFIEKTLGVRFVFNSTEKPYGESYRKTTVKIDHYWIEGLPAAITDTPFKNQTYSVTTPLPGNKAKVRFSFWAGTMKDNGRGINPPLVEEVFGPSQDRNHIINASLYQYIYQWNKTNRVMAGFTFPFTYRLGKKSTQEKEFLKRVFMNQNI